nr:Gag-Pol polyprotein [Tanacetum cinerariifolium]
MSTQQDIYAAGSESRPPMLNKENYVPWSSRLLWYAKSRPNAKLIHNSIINSPYTDDELTEKELKQIEADDQAIQTILLGLPEDIYTAVGNANLNGNGNLVAARAEGNAAGHNGNQIRCYNYRGVADLDEIEEVNANCILMANLQQASTSGTQTDKAPVYDSDESAEEKSTVSFLLEENKKLKSDFKTREDELLDKQIQLEKKIKELNNILVKTGRSIQTIHMLSPKPDLFYHTEQKMALGYQNPFYLKQAQKKQQSLYDGKVLLEKHDPSIVHDFEETLQLAQECRQKMKQSNKEIKPANYTKINHLSGVFISQTAKLREELYFLNDSKTANVSKLISIPTEEFSDDTTPSVARKFLNEVKSTIVTLQCVVKHRMTLKTHNWSFSSHHELHKIVKDENFPIVNQVDARVQNFEIQFLKEAAKFVVDFKSLAKEDDDSLAKHKALELKIERLLRAVVSQDSMSVVQKESIVDTSNLQTELEHTKERFENCIIKKENEYAKLWNDWINPFKTSREAKHVPNIVRASARTKPITVSQPLVLTKKDVNFNSHGFFFTGIDNTKTRRPQPRSNTKNDRQCLISVNRDICLRNYVNGKNSRGKKQKANVSIKEKQKKHQPKVTKPKKVGFIDILATPKPRKPRFLLRWSLTGILFDQKGKIVDSSESESQFDCSNGDNACTSNTLEPKIKRFPNFTYLLGRFMGTVRFKNDHVAAILGLPKFKYHKEHLCPSCEQGKSKRAFYPPKPVPNSRQRLHLLHMDLCEPMRIASINGKRTDNDTEFKNQVLKKYFDCVGISHQMSSVRTPQQNGVVEQKNRTLVEAARTMLIFSRAPLFLWAEAIATVCFTQNRSIIHRRFNKTPYELINGRKPDISFLHVFGALCYPKDDREDIGKLGAKAMAFEQRSSKPGLQSGQPSATARTVLAAQEPKVRQTSTASTSIADSAPAPTNSSSLAKNVPNTSQDDHPLEQVIGEPSRPVLTRNQLRSDGDMCMYALTVSTMEPKNVNEAMTDPAWIESMQEELLQFKRLDVWVLVPAPDNISPFTLNWLFKNKHDEEQTVIRNKSRLVVRGYR